MQDREVPATEEDQVAEQVRAFYERHPYPPPVTSLDGYRQRWADPARRRAETCLFWPRQPHREDRSILVAGCGTAQAAKYAVRWPNAKVIGIDVSASSIAETEKLIGESGIDNLEVHQLPVERVGEMGRSFELVVCTGVLHHLPEPDVGAKALHDVLALDGAMHLMVYAPHGRAGVYLLQDYCRRLGIGTSSKEIRELAATLRALPPDHPLLPLLRNSRDFHDEAGLADALLHPQDRAYSVPQLFEFLERAQLHFGRWLRQAPYSPHCGALASSAHQPLLAELAAEEQYAAAELFRGTMVRHSAVVYRDDRPTPRPSLRFDTEEWLSYVPIRMPDTLCVRERLPPGAAAVLINQTHTYTDIYLPITAQEKELFDAIDGERSIGEIVDSGGASEAARALFERLWWYDQVVFRAPSRNG